MANYRLSRSVLYPPFVFSAMWVLALTVYGAGLIEVDAIHNGLIVLILLGTLGFSLGGLLAWLVPSRFVNLRLRFGDALNRPRPVHLTKMLLLGLALAGLLFSAYNTISHGLQGGVVCLRTRERRRLTIQRWVEARFPLRPTYPHGQFLLQRYS